jgi:hypothetical protein
MGFNVLKTDTGARKNALNETEIPIWYLHVLSLTILVKVKTPWYLGGIFQPMQII